MSENMTPDEIRVAAYALRDIEKARTICILLDKNLVSSAAYAPRPAQQGEEV